MDSEATILEVGHLSGSGLNDISFSVSATELVCLSGPSGAGKTLMLRSLADLDVNEGVVVLEGRSREQIEPTQWRREVAYLPAESRWWARTVAEHFPSVPHEMLVQLGFRLDVLEWEVERLSSGERQRLALARLLLNKPKVLLLDEPTANLDPENIARVERLVKDYLTENRAACLWVTHGRDQIARVATRSFQLGSDGLIEEIVS